MIRIVPLADHTTEIPTLVGWFRAQWPDYFAGRTDEHMTQHFLSEASRERIPIRLVAFESGELAGTIVLREHAINAFPEFHPGLGGLYVAEPFRGRGIGAELVGAGMQLAGELGCQMVYATTVSAEGILVRLGWEFIQTLTQGEERLGLYRCDLQPSGQ